MIVSFSDRLVLEKQKSILSKGRKEKEKMSGVIVFVSPQKKEKDNNILLLKFF